MREVLNGWLCFNPKSSTPQRTKCNEEYMTLLPMYGAGTGRCEYSLDLLSQDVVCVA